jgi:hypothetical protein
MLLTRYLQHCCLVLRDGSGVFWDGIIRVPLYACFFELGSGSCGVSSAVFQVRP